MEQDDTGGALGGTTRRRVLSRLGAGSALTVGGTAGCITGSEPADQSTTAGGNSVTFGLSTSLSNSYLEIGRAERRGFELGIEHLNEGGGLVDSFDELSGDGVLGRTIETTVLDTGGKAETARSNLSPHLESDELAMFSGGVTGAVAREHSQLASKHAIPFFVGTSVLDSLTGTDCSQYVYRDLSPTTAIIHALSPVLQERFSDDSSFSTIYVDAPEGTNLQTVIENHFRSSDGPGWKNFGSTAIRPGSTDFSETINRIRSLRPSVVFCCVFGLDAVNLLQQASEGGADNTQFVVPLLDRSVSSAVKKNIGTIIGAVPWHSGVPSSRSNVFQRGYTEMYGESEATSSRTPSGPTHLMYGQTVVYAVAAERAGSFDPAAIKSELEGMEYDVGLGSETMQSCNHQATRPVVVVQADAKQSTDENWTSLLSVDSNSAIGCDSSPASNCSIHNK